MSSNGRSTRADRRGVGWSRCLSFTHAPPAHRRGAGLTDAHALLDELLNGPVRPGCLWYVRHATARCRHRWKKSGCISRSNTTVNRCNHGSSCSCLRRRLTRNILQQPRWHPNALSPPTMAYPSDCQPNRAQIRIRCLAATAPAPVARFGFAHRAFRHLSGYFATAEIRSLMFSSAVREESSPGLRCQRRIPGVRGAKRQVQDERFLEFLTGWERKASAPKVSKHIRRQRSERQSVSELGRCCRTLRATS